MMKNYNLFLLAISFLLCFQLSQNTLIASGNADFVLTVTGGTGGGNYASAAVVDIVADPAPNGMVFDRWVFIEGMPVIDSLYKASAKLTMPSMNVTVQALYMDEGPTYFDNCDALTGGFCDWSIGGTRTTIVINTTDMKEGAGCLENTIASGTTFFQSPRSTDAVGAATPVNTGATLANGILRLRFWVDDASKLGNNLSIEIGSGGLPDQGEIQFNITKANVKNGWNNFNLKLSAGGITKGTSGLDPDLAAINWFRIYSSSALVGIKVRLDGIMIYDPSLVMVDPPVIWNPAPVVVNTALGATQLNATSPVTGGYAYTPGTGTLMPEKGEKELKVTFTPSSWHQFIYNKLIDKMVLVNVIDATGVENVNEAGLKIYPNPVKKDGLLTVNINNNNSYNLRIVNMSGQTVFSKNMQGAQTIQLAGDLRPGAYIISCISHNSTTNQKLFVE